MKNFHLIKIQQKITCDENEKNLLNTEEEVDVTYIHSVNTTNDISMNYDENFIHKYYAPFLSSKNHEDVSSSSEYNSAKQTFCCHENIILDLLLKKPKSFEWWVSLLFFVLNDKKISSRMDQISEHINSSNHNTHSRDQISKMVVNLGSKTVKNNDNSSTKITHLQNS